MSVFVRASIRWLVTRLSRLDQQVVAEERGKRRRLLQAAGLDELRSRNDGVEPSARGAIRVALIGLLRRFSEPGGRDQLNPTVCLELSARSARAICSATQSHRDDFGVVISDWQDRRAIRRILGPDARSGNVRVLQRRRNRRALVFALDGGDERYVLKFYRRGALAEKEARNLELVNGIGRVKTPRYCGRTGRHFVQEFVDGAYLDGLARTEPYERFKARGLDAIRVLAEIHSSKVAHRDAVRLKNTFAPDVLRSRLERARSRLRDAGFSRYTELSGAPCAAWDAALSGERIDELTRDLQSDRSACVLGHGDYQPRHIIFTGEGEVYVVDWINLSLVTPWYELAHLFRWFSAEDRPELVTAYHEEMQQRGHLLDLTAARASQLSRSALAYERLFVVKDLVRKLEARDGADHLDSFKANMDALAGS